MDRSKGKIIINGGKPLNGEITVSGMKNAAVGILFATILTEDKCIIENLPDISDVNVSLSILEGIGVKVTKLDKNTVEIDSSEVTPGIAPYELVSKMRASYYLIGAELGRFGRAFVGLPGGCDFGVRPIDLHIKGFEALGCEVKVDGGYIEATAENGTLRGNSVYMDVVTVGGTINVMLAAVKAEGITIIENAAHEPHIVDTANFLNACGADISGAGTDVIKIRGVKKLHGCTHAIIPDMIEAGTFMILAAATGGTLRVTNLIPKHMESVTAKLCEMGVQVDVDEDALVVSRGDSPLKKINVKTLPYPGFPTDMHPQMCVLLCLANGLSHLTESVWDSRVRYVEELKRMGARITTSGRTAEVEGVPYLCGASVRAVDLRAGSAMFIAGLAAKGVTEIDEIYHIFRGYEDLIGKLQSVGADIKVVYPQNINYTEIE